ncbi:unnamed protein product [Prorocentrum cordatum]|uniref:Uncharacterized protein n=1 Tax=Prorocentrum cordatum TaxID=2364126 RepID=A0ABN9TPT4_9DINO|nr:unnamed protein product [Polarella glacialis]
MASDIFATKQGLGDVATRDTFLELCGDKCEGSRSPSWSSEPCNESSASHSAFFDADRIGTASVLTHVEEAWVPNGQETMKNSLETWRLSAAAETIYDIPEQLAILVQNKAKSLAEFVKIALALVQQAIRSRGGGEDGVDAAIDNLREIPEIIRRSFDSKIVEANGAMRLAMRLKLSAMVQMLKRTTPHGQELVRRMWTIPDQLEQIVRQAVGQAVEESQLEVARHCERVLMSLPGDAGVCRQALKHAESHIAEAVAEMPSETMRALRRTATASVRHAMACVEGP